MARIFRSKKPLQVETKYSSVELSWELQCWLFEQYGFCHESDDNQFIVGVYSSIGFNKDYRYTVGKLDHFECLYCGGMLNIEEVDPVWK